MIQLLSDPPSSSASASSGLALGGPGYSIDGQWVEDWIADGGESAHDAEGSRYRSESRPDARLGLSLQTSADGCVRRFRFRLAAPGRLTKPNGQDDLRYLTVPLPEGATVTETALANYDHLLNLYRPSQVVHPPDARFVGQRFHAPILTIEGGGGALLIAVEHGGDQPNPFLSFVQTTDGLELRAGIGNYLDGQAAVHESPWFVVALGASAEEARARFRRFLLEEHGPRESRRPHVFYNTWNHQERLKYLHAKPYLHEMNLERMLAEIDVAHEIGIEVFVIDTGWYAKTGDWEVNLQRFPDGLREVRRRLEEYGMRLGLWFNPIVAAETSRAYAEHPEWVMERKGQRDFWGPVWETEASYGMCLCSGWSDHFAETLIRLNHELGVSYFKWDAVGQWGCDAAHHDHGGPEHSVEERRANYAFESGRRLAAIAERVSRECPGAIVDFDVTEGGRYFGLGFLGAGKFFLVNNGPYYANFDIPRDFRREPETINVFFHPGPARPRVCRAGYRFDPLVPSVLYLTHYLPDGDRIARTNSFASLVLGGNGIWGSLPELTGEERAFWSAELARYKTVREAAARAEPIVVGEPGTSPEVHEKLDAETGEGLLSFFTVQAGRFTHVTRPLGKVPESVEGAAEWRVLPGGRLAISVDLPKDGACVVTLT